MEGERHWHYAAKKPELSCVWNRGANDQLISYSKVDWSYSSTNN